MNVRRLIHPSRVEGQVSTDSNGGQRALGAVRRQRFEWEGQRPLRRQNFAAGDLELQVGARSAAA
jgi:hypothetical protein